MGIKNNKRWTILAFALAILTIWAVVSTNKQMSFTDLLAQLRNGRPEWLILSVLCMLGIIFFEGEACIVILRAVGYPRSHRRGWVYGAADIYFSAITPSASGGQPATAYFMIKDGVPGAVVTAVLILNLVMYTLAVLSIALVCIIARPSRFLSFSIPSRILIVMGMLALSGLSVLFYMLLRHQHFLFGVAKKTVSFLGKHHLMRHPEKRIEKLETARLEYRDCVLLMSGRFGMLIKGYLLNLLQRLSQFGVILTVYMATGGKLSQLPELFAVQMYIILGSNCVPVPGGMGVTDYLMLDGYGQMFGPEYAFTLEMVGRSLSFYCCILISAFIVAAAYLRIKKREKQKGKTGT